MKATTKDLLEFAKRKRRSYEDIKQFVDHQRWFDYYQGIMDSVDLLQMINEIPSPEDSEDTK